MKKLFSILLTLALLAALCVPALAADPHADIVYLPEGAVEALSEDGADGGDGAVPSVSYHFVPVGDGLHLEILKTDASEVNEAALLERAARSEAIQKAEYLTAYELFKIIVVRDSTGEIVKWEEPIDVRMRYDKAVYTLTSFLQNDDESWEELSFEVNGDGSITLHMPHLTPVAFAYAKERTSGEEPGAGTVVMSPQTGYEELPWGFIALALAALAGVCFILAGRKERR